MVVYRCPSNALQLGEAHLDLLEKLFSVYYRLGLGLSVFSTHDTLVLETPEAENSCRAAFAALLQVTTNSALYYYKAASSNAVILKSGEFERQFGSVIETFYYARGQASAQMWSSSIQYEAEKLQSTDSIHRFLAPQDTVVQAITSGRISSRHNRAELTCEWASKRLSDLARGKNGLTLLTGKEYCGKSVLAGWIAVSPFQHPEGLSGGSRFVPT